MYTYISNRRKKAKKLKQATIERETQPKGGQRGRAGALALQYADSGEVLVLECGRNIDIIIKIITITIINIIIIIIIICSL